MTTHSHRPLRQSLPLTLLTLPSFIIHNSAFSPSSLAADPTPATLTLDLSKPPTPISTDLFGIFFEDINYAADGGLYAELVQNRSFDYQPTDHPGWHPLTSWDLLQRDGSKGAVSIDAAFPLHPNNPTYAVLETFDPRGNVGLSNTGFDGIPITANESYNLSVHARHLYTNRRWKPIEEEAAAGANALLVRLEAPDGSTLAEAAVPVPHKPEWSRLTATLKPTRSEPSARLVLLLTTRGGVALDMVSLFPANTFKGHGLRTDLAQAIADLKPKFVRFPGGCLVHGSGLPNMYRWKDSIGPVEHRKAQPNIWRYHQSLGLGYFEYFQFCEDIGAKPLPVLPAAVSCQNSGFMGGTGQQALPLEDMPAYIQEVLDLIEYANGPATSTWGAKRAAAGHPQPFNLQYLGIGNEEHITPAFKERFKIIYDAVHPKHPEITLIGTAGPFWKGEDFDQGWSFAKQLKLPLVDEHYYESPAWFRDNLTRYDSYNRTGPHVYLGEYASKSNSLESALAEAAYMTHLERNADVVRMASYAPLLGKRGHTQWNPNLIYFTNTSVHPTVNYHVQKLFSTNPGDAAIPSTLSAPQGIAASTLRDSATNSLILKLVNLTPTSTPLQIHLPTAKLSPDAIRTQLTGDPTDKSPEKRLPQSTPFTPSPSFTETLPPHSVTILRLKELP